MTDPVTTLNGQTYERAFIEEWLVDHATDPLTNTAIPRILFPNYSLKALIFKFKESQASQGN